MTTLDKLLSRDAAHRAKVAACPHRFTEHVIGGAEFGNACALCGTHELPWLRSEYGRLTTAITEAEERMRERAARVLEEMAPHYGPGPIIAAIRGLPTGVAK